MNIGIVTPAPPRMQSGNRITALRWKHLLQSLGHRVRVQNESIQISFDVLIALHAKRSYDAIRRFHQQHPDRPLIVALTGTDLYRDLKSSRRAWESLEMASHIVALQPEALKELPRHLRRRAHVIFQSVNSDIIHHWGERTALTAIRRTPFATRDPFTVCVVGHLRYVKDPFRAAMAARCLPASSHIQIVHIGGALTVAMQRRAEREMKINPRYQWLGEVPHKHIRQILAESDL